MTDHQAKVTSQYGQDGALAYVFENIGTTNRYYVEYGFNAKTWEGGTGSNTLQLHLAGWTGLLLDGENANPAINLAKAWIAPATIAATLATHGVPFPSFDLLCNDIDSADLWVLRAVLSAGYRPRVVLTEFNVNYPIEATLTSSEEAPWQGPVYGASFGAFTMMMDEFGYSAVDVVGHDILFVLRSQLRGSQLPSSYSFSARMRKQMHGPQRLSRERLATQLVDYAAWRAAGGALQPSQGAAVLQQLDSLEIFTRYNGTAS